MSGSSYEWLHGVDALGDVFSSRDVEFVVRYDVMSSIDPCSPLFCNGLTSFAAKTVDDRGTGRAFLSRQYPCRVRDSWWLQHARLREADPGNAVAWHAHSSSFQGGGHGNCLAAGLVHEGALWMKPNSMLRSWSGADDLSCCSILGLSGWRLPTCDELVSVFRSGLPRHQRWSRHFFWSSTLGPSGSHYVVNSADADVYVNDDDNSLFSVTLVRDVHALCYRAID